MQIENGYRNIISFFFKYKMGKPHTFTLERLDNCFKNASCKIINTYKQDKNKNLVKIDPLIVSRDSIIEGECVCGNIFKKGCRRILTHGGPFCEKCTTNNRMIKTIEHNLEYHGVKHTLQRRDIREQGLKTMQNTYGEGITNISQVPEIKERKIQTTIKNHGVSHPSKSKKLIKKGHDTYIRGIIDNKKGILYTHPEISQEWDQQKNEDITPEMVTHCSGFPAWWICPTTGHSYRASVGSRCSSHSGCPCCKNKTERMLLEYLIKKCFEFSIQFKIERCRYKKQLPFDFCLTLLKIIIELDGRQHFKQVHKRGDPIDIMRTDVYKMGIAIQEGFRVIRVSQEDVFKYGEEWLDKNLLPAIMNHSAQVEYISSDLSLYDSHKRCVELYI
jgi:very-short-patch-repair endonuclease